MRSTSMTGGVVTGSNAGGGTVPGPAVPMHGRGLQEPRREIARRAGGGWDVAPRVRLDLRGDGLAAREVCAAAVDGR